MAGGPLCPIEDPRLGIIPKAFPEEADGNVVDGKFRGSHGDTNVSVFPFRRARAPHPASAAGDDPSSSPAIPLGELVNAVVLRLSNKRVRLKVLRASGLGGGEDEGPR
ncbi:hypothetical protein GOA99_19680 [Sinorhizobium meliloti]|nr:hypothetical protein [Sinorhizobium meliloti]MQV26834.1 hypothetical protein [Sinorhizobium meliloti]